MLWIHVDPVVVNATIVSNRYGELADARLRFAHQERPIDAASQYVLRLASRHFSMIPELL